MSGLHDVSVALTLAAPWASLVVEGPKDLENRSWPPPKWVIGTKIAIHAGKKVDDFGTAHAAKVLAMLAQGGQWKLGDEDNWKTRDVRGAIIGTAVVTGYVEQSTSPWFFGPFAWTLEDRRVLPVPVPCRGFQKLWALTRDQRAA